MNKKEKFYSVNKTNWGHKWGFRDSQFILNKDRSVSMTGNRYELCGIDMPDFIPYVEEELGITIDPNDVLNEIENKPFQKANINTAFFDEIKSNFPEDRYTIDDKERLMHSQGQTTDEVYKAMYSKINKLSDMVFYIESEEETQTLIHLA